MKIKAIYDAEADIPAAFKELFTERNGKWELTGVEGVRTQGDVDRLTTAHTKEKDEHKVTKTRLSKILGDRKDEDLIAILDKVPELEAQVEGIKDPKKIDDLVEARIKGRLAPLERKLKDAEDAKAAADVQVGELGGKLKQRTIADAVREAALAGKVRPEALDDVLMHAERTFDVGEDGKVSVKDGVGFTPGLDAATWLGDLKAKRPHWWPETAGGGASGGKGGASGANPWAAGQWNVTEQANIIRGKGEAEATRLATAAGVALGATGPAKAAA